MRGRMAHSAMAGVLMIALGISGCAEDTSATETERIHGAVETVAHAFTVGDIPTYAASFTDQGILEDQDMSRAQFLAMDKMGAVEFGGLPMAITDWGKTVVDGDKATAEVVMKVDDTWMNGYTLHLQKQDDLWLIDAGLESEPYQLPLPEGVSSLAIDRIQVAKGKTEAVSGEARGYRTTDPRSAGNSTAPKPILLTAAATNDARTYRTTDPRTNHTTNPGPVLLTAASADPSTVDARSYRTSDPRTNPRPVLLTAASADPSAVDARSYRTSDPRTNPGPVLLTAATTADLVIDGAPSADIRNYRTTDPRGVEG